MLYVSGREAAIVGETRSLPKRPPSSLKDGIDVLCAVAVDFEGEIGESIVIDGVAPFSVVISGIFVQLVCRSEWGALMLSV